MPLIRTKLLPATKTKGTKIKAYYQEQSVTRPYNYSFSVRLNHKHTCIALLDKLGFKWVNWGILSEQLSPLEYVHVWNTQNKTDSTLPECLKPQA